MSLIQSAKLNGIDPHAYLKDVLTRLPTQSNSRIDDLLPHNWQTATTQDFEIGVGSLTGGAPPRTEEINAYIDRHRDEYEVEPIFKVLQIASSTYWCYAAPRRNSGLRSQRAKRNK